MYCSTIKPLAQTTVHMHVALLDYQNNNNKIKRPAPTALFNQWGQQHSRWAAMLDWVRLITQIRHTITTLSFTKKEAEEFPCHLLLQPPARPQSSSVHQPLRKIKVAWVIAKNVSCSAAKWSSSTRAAHYLFMRQQIIS